MVAARHLFHYGYEPEILYPKQPAKDLYQRLVRQCEKLNIPITSSVEDFNAKGQQQEWALIVDALFGFSFKGPLRGPFVELIPVRRFFHSHPTSQGTI